MSKTDQLHKDLQTLLLRYPDAKWISESDEPIYPCKRGWWQLFGLKRERDGMETMLLESAVDAGLNGGVDMQTVIDEAKTPLEERNAEIIRNGYRGLWEIAKLMLKQDRLIALRRKTKKPSVYTIYILAYFGWEYVGIKFNVTES